MIKKNCVSKLVLMAVFSLFSTPITALASNDEIAQIYTKRQAAFGDDDPSDVNPPGFGDDDPSEVNPPGFGDDDPSDVNPPGIL